MLGVMQRHSSLSSLTGLSHLSLGYSLGRLQEDEGQFADAQLHLGGLGGQQGEDDDADDEDGNEDDGEEFSSDEGESSAEEESSDDSSSEESESEEEEEEEEEAPSAAAGEAGWLLVGRSLSEHAAAWAALPTLQQLSVTCYSLGPFISSAIAAATSITSLELVLKEQEMEFDIASLLAPLKQLQRLAVYDYHGHVSAVASALGSMAGIRHLALIGTRLSPLARTQLVTYTHLRRLFVHSADIGNDEIEAMGHYMTRLQALGVCLDHDASLGGVMHALNCGRFPALQRLVLDSDASGHTQGKVRSHVASVRPHVAVEHEMFIAPMLLKYL
jgi:hypothetical protein